MWQLTNQESEMLLRALERAPGADAEMLLAAASLRRHLDSTSAGTSEDLEAESMAEPSCTLHVCTSCRPPSAPREPREERPGFRLYQAVRAAIEASSLKQRVDVRPADCLSLCPRPCGVALSSPGAWSYLFGDQGSNAHDIVECVRTYLGSTGGHLPRDRRPETMRANILGRVPPGLGVPRGEGT